MRKKEMDNQKLENILNLSLETDPLEREKSQELNVGYDAGNRTWELIIKYNGEPEAFLSPYQEQIKFEKLIAGYGILTVPENLVDWAAGLSQIEYIEKPKRLFFSVEQGKRASCLLSLTMRSPFLTGNGVRVAVIDSGIAYELPVFRNMDGTTKIYRLWDQSLDKEFTREQINTALEQPTRQERQALVPSEDQTGHGTAVAGIAVQIAPDSELIIVKLGKAQENGFPQTTELLRALTYVTLLSLKDGTPVSINLSFGNTYGSHDGTSLLERFMDNVSEIGRNVVCVGSGNEGAFAGHLTGIVNGRQTEQIELAVGESEGSFSVQLWKNYPDSYTITIRSPEGRELGIDISKMGKQELEFAQAKLLVYVGEPTPYSTSQEIYFDFLPRNASFRQGNWQFLLTPIRIIDGRYTMYLPSSGALSAGTGFYLSTPDRTLTIPSTAGRVISVGAYDSGTDRYADFSGRGYLEEQRYPAGFGLLEVKPDICAPGVNIQSVNRDGTNGSFTGTSFATPFVTGSAALMMEWGIIRGNDPYLYGEKVKAYLIKGARQLPGMENPNPMTGWGALCVSESLPV